MLSKTVVVSSLVASALSAAIPAPQGIDFSQFDVRVKPKLPATG